MSEKNAVTIDTPLVNPMLDAGSIDVAELDERRLPSTVHGRARTFQTVFRRSVLNEIHRHGSIRTDVEICGVLVGTSIAITWGRSSSSSRASAATLPRGTRPR